MRWSPVVGRARALAQRVTQHPLRVGPAGEHGELLAVERHHRHAVLGLERGRLLLEPRQHAVAVAGDREVVVDEDQVAGADRPPGK
jgi:hypothetical protein